MDSRVAVAALLGSAMCISTYIVAKAYFKYKKEQENAKRVDSVLDGGVDMLATIFAGGNKEKYEEIMLELNDRNGALKNLMKGIMLAEANKSN